MQLIDEEYFSFRACKKEEFAGDITSAAWVQIPPAVYKNPSISQIDLKLPACIA